MDISTLWTIMLLGFMIVFIGIILIFIASLTGIGKGAKVEGGGLVMIGPIPIVFGTSRGIVKILLILGIVLVALLIFYHILPIIMR
ncbi:MAG: hypothetical protein DRO15_06310 [Thermoprotei archaeon]|nr:MAG: hypothetical protein DRO15_06310 [Thermoprotei archaeon]